MIKIIYNSPAMPQYPYDVKVGISYECKKVKNKYMVKGVNFERELSLKFIKNMFKPCDGYSWDMLEETKNENTKSNNSKQQNKTIKEEG